MGPLARLAAVAVLCASCGSLPQASPGDEALSRPLPPSATVVLVHGWGSLVAVPNADSFYGVAELSQLFGLHRGFDAIHFYRSLLGKLHDQGW